MKKFFLFLVFLLTALAPVQGWAQDKEVDFILNGEHIHDVVTIEQSGRTLVSVRQLAEMLAADVNFEKKTVVFQKNGRQTSLRPSLIKDGRSFAPLRSVAEALGATVDFDAANNSIEIWAEGIDFPRQPSSVVTTPSTVVVSKATKNQSTVFNVTIDGRSVTLKDGLIYRDGVRFVSAEDLGRYFATDSVIRTSLYDGNLLAVRFYSERSRKGEDMAICLNQDLPEEIQRWVKLTPTTYEFSILDVDRKAKVNTQERETVVGNRVYRMFLPKPDFKLPAKPRDTNGKFFVPIAVLEAVEYRIEDRGDTFIFYSRDGNMGGAAQWLEPATAQ